MGDCIHVQNTMHQASYLAHHSLQYGWGFGGEGQKQNKVHVNEVMAGLTGHISLSYMSVKRISMHKCFINKSRHMPAEKYMQKEKKTEH